MSAVWWLWLLTTTAKTVCANALCMCCDMLPFVRLVSRLQSGGCTNKPTRFFHQHQQIFSICRLTSTSLHLCQIGFASAKAISACTLRRLDNFSASCRFGSYVG